MSEEPKASASSVPPGVNKPIGMVLLDGWQCQRCGHTWRARYSRRPVICPKCKSAYWDRPRGGAGK